MSEAAFRKSREGLGPDFRLRRAMPLEAPALSSLARRSKAYWGYGEEFIEACQSELTLTPEFVENGEVHVIERDGCVAGFYSLAEWNSDVELHHFFVDPPLIGKGAGRLLWDDAVERAVALGYGRLLIQSDPNAEGFYLKLGAERIGDVPSQAVAGRLLPLLLFPLQDGRDSLAGAGR